MKISINLLPAETIAEEAKRSKFYKIQFIGVAVILILIFLTSLTLALQILQNNNIASAQAKVAESEGKVVSLKNTQVSLFILKNRLNTIGAHFGVPSKQSAMYEIIDELTPLSVSVSTVSVDKTGTVTLLASTSDRESLDEFISNLINKETNKNLISEVAIDTLNRSKDGYFRISLRIKTQ